MYEGSVGYGGSVQGVLSIGEAVDREKQGSQIALWRNWP